MPDQPRIPGGTGGGQFDRVHHAVADDIELPEDTFYGGEPTVDTDSWSADLENRLTSARTGDHHDLNQALRDPNPMVRSEATVNPQLTRRQHARLARDRDMNVRIAAACRPKAGGADLAATLAKADGTTGGSTGGTASGCSPCPTGGSTDISGVSVGNIDGLKPDQLANAQTIAKVALSRGLGERGVLIGIMTAMTESDLINVGHGDAMGPSSIGLYQQMGSWGPLAVRTDPAGAAGLFYDAMVQVPSWQTADPWVVAQSVEQSEFKAGYTGEGSDGTVGYNYHKLMATAQSYTTSLMAGATGAAAPTGNASTGATTAASTAAPTGSAPATTGAAELVSAGAGASGCTAAGGTTVISNGPNITLPNNPNIAQQLRGKVIKAPTTQVAAGLVWALQNALGLPYIYGGGGLGSANPGGPDNGMARAAGELNSGTGTGYDCSGLTWSVTFHMNPSLSLPDGNSGAMASGGTHIPYAQQLPGDMITFNGHVAMSLGMIDGVVIILEAPEPGKNVRILPMFRNDYHDWVTRYWAPGTVAPPGPAA